MEQKRVNYFQGMMLVDDDFRLDQTYHRKMLGYHNIELHTWGVVRGLEVSVNAGKFDVKEGVAIDAEGKQIWWKGGDPTPAGTATDGGYIVIEWHADLSDEYSQMKGTFLRWIDNCTFSFKSSVAPNDVVLARLGIRVQQDPLKPGVSSTDIDNSVRRTASSVRVDQDNNLEIRPVTKDSSLRLMTGLTERLTIDRTGNVGVGTTAPTQRLQVEGGDILVKGAGSFFSGQEARLYFGDTNHYIKAISGSGVRIGSYNAVDGISLLQGGNVGIGTTDPGSSRLKIANTPTDFADVRFAQSGTGQLEILGWSQGWNINAKTDGKNLFLNRDSLESSNVLIGRSGKELFVKGSDGKVGVGTNDPQASLHVRGNQAAGSSQGLLNLEGTDHAYIQWFPLGFSNGRKGWMGYGKASEKNFTIQNEITDGHVLFNAGSGRVGVGTAAPAAAFQVRGTPGNKGRATFCDDVSALFACKTDNGGNTPKDPETVMVLAREGVETQSFANFVRFDLGMYGDKKTQLNIRLNHDSLESERNNTPVILSLRSNSNVGIATSQPAAKLEIQGGAGNAGESDPKAMAFSYSTGGFRHWIRTRHNLNPGAGNAFDFYVNNSATADGSSAPTAGTLHAMTLDSGKVGIGTTSPGSDLHIRRNVPGGLGPTLLIQNFGGARNAEARIDIATYDFADASPNFRLQVIDDGSNGAHVDFTTKLAVKDNRAALISRLYIRSDGNIGIGTAQPGAKLEIKGGADSGGASDPMAVAFSHRSGGFRHWIRTRHNAAIDKGNAIDFYVNNSTAADGSSAPTTGTLHVMTLDSGKVGIGGVTEPKETLDVGGDIRLSDRNLYFKDKNCGIGYFGGNKKFNAEAIDGPVIYGWSGGALGSNQNLQAGTAQKIALRWDTEGNVSVGKNLKVSNAVSGFGLEPSDGSPNAGYIRFGDSTGWKLHFGRANSGGTALTGLTGVIMTLQDQGKVGIGTTSPDGVLEIKGTASEVKVKFGGKGGDVHHLSSTRDLVFNSTSGQFTFRKVDNYGDVTSFTDLLKITDTGNIFSPKWNVSSVINQTGPLNINKSFSTGGGRLIIFASGSAFRNNAGTIGMYVYLDGNQLTALKGYTNESGSHKSMVSFPIVVEKLAAGSHTIELRPLATDVYMDGNDYFNVTILELPF